MAFVLMSILGDDFTGTGALHRRRGPEAGAGGEAFRLMETKEDNIIKPVIDFEA